ncbi:hypothetical protein llh_10775 [Lactococcus cremoris subsp. cremoris A76]|uniref:DUF1642 domain-containing protein n=1 Tax=Lactococcus lactis subsp. cremoris TaxID=1359 RepID=UPI000238D2D6|nr:DUF1642 domain-containing protein [Lactococcus cremoris]AEU41331.1 hypothetical protein llh_10775 [Lactococcus cremoris subsp. cremoris A76]
MTKFELPEKPKKTNTSEDVNNLRKAVDELDKFDYAWKTYANKADRRIDAANKHIEELERENQRLVAENLTVKTLVDSAKQQQSLPVVPECVGSWIECVKEKNNNALALLDDDNMPDDVNEWLFFQRNDDNINLILRAWLDGYTVEKPQLFYIELPKVFGLSDSTFVSKAESGIISEFTKGKDYALKLTEQEINSIDERYWQFAVPVEDGE